MADSRKQIVIIGGGAGGIMAANRLRKELRPEEADITLIERNLHHFYQPGYLTLLFDIDQPEKLCPECEGPAESRHQAAHR